MKKKQKLNIIPFKENNSPKQVNILRFAKFLIFIKLFNNLVLFIFKSVIEGENSFTLHKHFAFCFRLSYSEKQQSS